jgi:hypothetical protein
MQRLDKSGWRRCVAMVSVIVVCESMAQAAEAEKARTNFLIVLADDKYESAEPKAQNLRENRQNAAFPAKSQIAGNYGKFRGITGN